jgi:tRNA(fMet)-specific endonuclease VapC
VNYLLDTNICIYLINKRPKSVLEKFYSFDIDQIGISSITISELEYGAFKSNFPEKTRIALLEFLLPFKILVYDSKAASHYGMIRADLERKGQPIGSMDYLIAAHALSENLILVSNNIKEFSKVEGLQYENWL